MSASHIDRLEKAKVKRELLESDLANLKLEREIKLTKAIDKVRMSYDSVNPAYDKQRKQVSIEREAEEGILDSRKRLKAIAKGRDLHRNDSNAKTILNTFAIHTVGTGPKARAHTDKEDWNKEFSRYINSDYAKNCDARGDGLHLADFETLTLLSVKRDGDVLIVFDDFINDTGKLYAFEADQLVDIDSKQWIEQAIKLGYSQPNPLDRRKRIPLNQSNGLVYDSLGETLFYVVSSEHGAYTKKLEEVTIIPKSSARLVKKPFRFNQKRGVADLLTIADDLQDIKELRKIELSSAKNASKQAVVIKSDDSLEMALARTGIDADSLITDSGTDETTLTLPKVEYEAMGEYAGGFVEHLGKDDSVELLRNDRPNPDVATFSSFIMTQAGASLGLANLYTSLKATKSYTGARAEMLLTALQFQTEQKWLERSLLDWLVTKVVEWSVRNDKISAPPIGWETAISWGWQNPVLALDPYKEIRGIILKVKAGLTTFSEELGPDWKEQLGQLAKEIETLEALGILRYNAISETVAGAPIEDIETDIDNEETTDLT